MSAHQLPIPCPWRLRRLALLLAGFWLAAVCATPVASAAEPSAATRSPWISGQGEATRVSLYFFWTRTCPHCLRARPFVLRLEDELPWLDVHAHELTRAPEAARLYIALAGEVGETPASVPAFLFCGQMLAGFDDADGVGTALRDRLERCHQRVKGGGPVAPQTDVVADGAPQTLPVLGEVDMSRWSLPTVAVVLGALDSFNPCAFFVLLFLLSLLVNARSRARMLLVGGLFVLVSGGIYFVFMSAWLNLFLFVGQFAWVTAAAGLLAVMIGGLNVKDYFYFQSGPSLSMPASAKPGLFRRMRSLIGARSVPAMLAGTLALAVLANAYELLCTAGFPMVFTRILTLHALSPAAYYGYIGLYCAVYVLPLLIIVTLFVATLGRHKLSERQGRILKLVSGIMMLSLGVLLLVDPGLLSSIGVTLALLAGVLTLSWLIVRFAPVGPSPADR
jgi:thiol-disulfide isomerase/thioredoxin